MQSPRTAGCSGTRLAPVPADDVSAQLHVLLTQEKSRRDAQSFSLPSCSSRRQSGRFNYGAPNELPNSLDADLRPAGHSRWRVHLGALNGPQHVASIFSNGSNPAPGASQRSAQLHADGTEPLRVSPAVASGTRRQSESRSMLLGNCTISMTQPGHLARGHSSWRPSRQRIAPLLAGAFRPPSDPDGAVLRGQSPHSQERDRFADANILLTGEARDHRFMC